MTRAFFTLLIADSCAADYAEPLRVAFPDVRILTATDRSALRALIVEADGLITFGTELDAIALDCAPRLRWIQALSTGTDRISPLLSTRTGIILTSARGAHGASVSEMALLLMLALARRLPSALRHQRNHVWIRETGTLLSGKTVGIAGMGVIGAQIAARSKAFGMLTIGFGSDPATTAHFDAFHRYSELRNIANRIDMLVVVTPLRTDTIGMIDRHVFEAMKRTAFLINVGRGAVVNESDLVAALLEGRIAGAAIDTFAEEPLPIASPLWALENVIVTPHIGGLHDGYAESVLPLIKINLQFLLDGQEVEMVNQVELKNGTA